VPLQPYHRLAGVGLSQLAATEQQLRCSVLAADMRAILRVEEERIAEEHRIITARLQETEEKLALLLDLAICATTNPARFRLVSPAASGDEAGPLSVSATATRPQPQSGGERPRQACGLLGAEK